MADDCIADGLVIINGLRVQISPFNVIGELPKKKPKQRHARTTVLPSRKRKSGENEDTTCNGIILLFSGNMN